MKKYIIFLMLLILSATSFSQDYLRKSKNQKTAAWILLGGGSALVVTGILLANNATIDNLGTGAGVAIAGGVVMLGSIPLFLASGRNKKKGMRLSFKNETAPQLLKGSFVYRPVPSVSLKISF